MKLVSVNFEHMEKYENFYNTIAAAEFSMANQKTKEDVLRCDVQLGNACEQLIEMTAAKAGLIGSSRDTLERLHKKNIISSESMNKFIEVLKHTNDASTAIKTGKFENGPTSETLLNIQRYIYEIIYQESYLFRYGDSALGDQPKTEKRETSESTGFEIPRSISDTQTIREKQSPIAWILCGVLAIACIALGIAYGSVREDYNTYYDKYYELKKTSKSEEIELENKIADYQKQIKNLEKNANLYNSLLEEIAKTSYNGVNTSTYSNIVAIKEGTSTTIPYYANGYVSWKYSQGLDCEEVSYTGTTLKMKFTGRKKGVFHFSVSGDKEFNTTVNQVVWVY